jgi:hypothetical protein
VVVFWLGRKEVASVEPVEPPLGEACLLCWDTYSGQDAKVGSVTLPYKAGRGRLIGTQKDRVD